MRGRRRRRGADEGKHFRGCARPNNSTAKTRRVHNFLIGRHLFFSFLLLLPTRPSCISVVAYSYRRRPCFYIFRPCVSRTRPNVYHKSVSSECGPYCFVRTFHRSYIRLAARNKKKRKITIRSAVFLINPPLYIFSYFVFLNDNSGACREFRNAIRRGQESNWSRSRANTFLSVLSFLLLRAKRKRLC